MVGGTEAAFERVKPLFEKMGKNITLVGENGAGQTTKVANQIIVALTIEAVAEGLLFASEGGGGPGEGAPGADGRPGDVADPGAARQPDDRADLQSGVPDRAAPEGPEFGAAGRAGAWGSACRTRPHAQELFNACVAHGGKAWDHSGMVKALEKMANFEIGQK